MGPGSAQGLVVLTDRGRRVESYRLRNGLARMTVRLARGRHVLVARYVGDADHRGSRSRRITLRVR